MPELPEVETVVRTLETLILHRKIEDVRVHTPSIVYFNDGFQEKLINQTIQSFSRRGKYIIIQLTDCFLIIHLRMEGRFFINTSFERVNKHVHVSFQLDDQRVLHYQDTRKFGRMLMTDNVSVALSHIGIEFNDPAFTPKLLYDAMRKSKRSLKAFLLSQEVITGLGNIYVDEVCFRSRIHPETIVNGLKLKHIKVIHKEIIAVLNEAIALGGSSIRTYTNAMGIDGLFQLKLQVHMRAQEPCIVCGRPIIKIVVANRGTYVCTHCQKELK
jgi:formamidopyrimidine-DNA glycosylase